MGLCQSSSTAPTDSPVKPRDTARYEQTGKSNSSFSQGSGGSQNVRKAEDTGPVPPHKRAVEKTASRRGVKDLFTLHEVLGKGGFGEVRVATRRGDGKRVAMKIISKLKFATEEDRANMLTEVDLMQRVRGHPNVVELYDWFEEKSGFYLAMELAEGGELMDRIIKMNHFSEKVAAKYFQQMLLGVKYCHDHNVVHRDLKPENFLLVDSSPDAELKITDFGLSCYIRTPDEVITEACGSAYYIAPEIFKKKYTKAVDAWALGVILFLLLSGTVPFGFNAETESEVYKAIQKDPLVLGRQWNSITPAARELVCGLLEKDPYKRYTIEQALAHPWVTGDAAADVPIDKSLIKSMIEFNHRNRFKKAALKLVASTLSAVDVQSLRAQFEKIDNDGSGFITFTEMAQALSESGMSKADIDGLIKRLDQDGDGRISWPEFLEALVDQQLVYHQNNIWWAFCEYDKDGDGKITYDELALIMKDESPERIKKYIAEYDINNDGKIDYEEFMRMLLPKNLLNHGIRFIPNSTS